MYALKVVFFSIFITWYEKETAANQLYGNATRYYDYCNEILQVKFI